MQLELNRDPTDCSATFGELLVDGRHECITLEDAIREVDGEPVSLWKVPHETAIPSGLYRVTLEQSPRFGADTITINHVPGFDGVRMHGGNSIDDTEGCPLVGDREDRQHMLIYGAKSDGVLNRLRAKIRAAIDAGDQVWITIRNPS